MITISRTIQFIIGLSNVPRKLFNLYCVSVRYCNPATKIIIFKTRHGPHTFLSSVLPFITKLQEKQIQLSTIYTGASMFQCFKFIQVIN